MRKKTAVQMGGKNSELGQTSDGQFNTPSIVPASYLNSTVILLWYQ